MKDPIERQNYILSVTSRWDASAMETVTRALEDPHPIVRYAAANLLGDAGDKVPTTTVQALINHMQDPDYWVRQQTIGALQRLTDFSVPRYSALGLKIQAILLKLTKDPDPFIQSEAIGALEKWEDSTQQAFSWYEMADKDELWLVRSKARRRLLSRSETWLRPSIDAVRQYLRDEDQTLRLAAVLFLHERILSSSQPDVPIVDLLTDRLSDPNSQIVYEAIWLLALTKHPKAIRALAWKAEQSSEWLSTIRTALHNNAEIDLEQALENTHRDPVTFAGDPSPIDYGNTGKLMAMLADKDESIRVRAVLGLCWIRDSTAEDAVVVATHDASARVRYAAAFSFSEWTCHRKHSNRIISALQSLSEDSNVFVRRMALASLHTDGWNRPERRSECTNHRRDWLELFMVLNSCNYTPFNSPKDDRALLPLLTIPYDRLREAVTRRVAWACVPDQKQLLRGLLKDSSVRVRQAVTHGLGSHPDFVPLLLSALDDKDERVRLIAVQSLSQYGAASALEPLSNLAETDPSEDVQATASLLLRQVAAHAALPTHAWDAEARNRLERTLPSHCKPH